MKHYRTAGFLLGAVFLSLGMGKAAWAVDYSGTLDFASGSTTVPMTVDGVQVPVPVGFDLDHYDLGSALAGPIDISFTTHNAFDATGTLLGLIFATDPNDAFVSDPASFVSLFDPAASPQSILDSQVTGWTFAAYNTGIVSNGTSNISGLFDPPQQFALGTHYYAFVVGGTTRSGELLTDPSVGYTLSVGAPSVSAVPEPEAYAMMLFGLGLIGAMRRRRKGAATA